LNENLTYCAQCCFSYGKWKIIDAINEGVNSKTRTLLEFLCFHSKSVGKAWYIFKWLTDDTYKFENIGWAFGMSFPDPYVLD